MATPGRRIRTYRPAKPLVSVNILGTRFHRYLKFFKMKEMVPMLCPNCRKEFKKARYIIQVKLFEKSKNLYCCSKCFNEHFSKKCYKKSVTQVICEQCGKEFLRKKKAIKMGKLPFSFCTMSCRTTYTNIHLPKGVRRSKTERMMERIIRHNMPYTQLRCNDRVLIPSGLEIDIVIPKWKLAVEVNGPTHYINMYGDEELAKVKAKDLVKEAEVKAMGWKFIIIDISNSKNYNGGKVQMNCGLDTKIMKYLQSEFDTKIRPELPAQFHNPQP